MLEDLYGVLDDAKRELSSRKATSEGDAGINNVVLCNRSEASDGKGE